MRYAVGITTALVLGLCLSTGLASAHHAAVGMGAGEAGPIRTMTSDTLPQGRFALDVQGEYISLKRFPDDQISHYAEEGTEVHSIDSVFHTYVAIGYGITGDLSVSLRIPYAYLNNIRAGHLDEPEEVHQHGDSKGLGDLSVMGRYRVLNNRESGLGASLMVGLKLPTGRTGVTDLNGERFETEHQPGSGSWDPIIGLSVTKRSGRVSLDANVLYTMATKGAQDTDLGDLFNYNAAVSCRAVETPVAVDLVLEANGEWKQRQKVGGVKDDNSGESLIFLSPGIRVSVNKNWMAYLLLSFPVYQHVNGIQNETSARTLFGAGFSF